jgi:hypothetical protein
MVNEAKLARRDAETVAVQGLCFLAGDPGRLDRFLTATGIIPADIRSAARDPAFLGGVLDHLADDESVMLAFARETGIPPERIAAARALLSGRPLARDVP